MNLTEKQMARPSTSYRAKLHKDINTPKQLIQYHKKHNNFVIQIPKSCPKLINKEQIIRQVLERDRQKLFNKLNFHNNAQNKNKNGQSKSIYKILDEEHRSINRQNMQILGLTVQKVNYIKKQKKFSNISDNHQTKSHNLISIDTIPNGQVLKLQNDQSTAQIQFQQIKKNIFKRVPRMTQTSKNQTIRLTNRSSSKHTEKRRQSMKPISSQYQNTVYQARIFSYRQLLFKLNWSYGHYMEMQNLEEDSSWREKRYKVYIGGGNNSQLIKELMRRRFWWQIVDDKNIQTNFLWTQLKNNDYFKKQQAAPLWFLSKHKRDNENASLQLAVSQQIKTKVKGRNKKQQIFKEDQFLYKIMPQHQRIQYLNEIKSIRNKQYWQRQNVMKLKQISSTNERVHNHLINNFYLGNKKALFYNLKEYYQLTGGQLFKTIPLTFHIKKGTKDPQFKRFVMYHKKRQAFINKQEKMIEKGEKVAKVMRNIWIVKPGQLTNRGNGITVIDQIYELQSIFKSQGKHDNGTQKTFIVQLYIDRPFLYKNRKFDIRHYMIISQLNGIFKAYWYKQGYIRTSSYEFNVFDFQREIHLTNDAVQKYTNAYGRYEPANKLSYQQFQKYLDTNYKKQKYNLEEQILPKMKSICLDSVKSVFTKISPERFKHNFQIFGMDFMIDSQFNPWLIEINTNPCLELACPLLTRIIPQMVDQAFRLTLDVIYPPPCNYPNTVKHLVPDASLESLKFQLIFDERVDGQAIRSLYKRHRSNLLQEIGNISDDQVYQDKNPHKICLDEMI